MRLLMTLSLKSTAEIQLTELVSITNRAFDGYIGGQLVMEIPSLLSFVASEGTNLNLSRVVIRDGEEIGIALVARMGWSNRLVMMGIVPEAAGKGVGRWFMEKLIDEARERGDRHYELEVIEQNEPGVRLYTRCGFEVVQRLVGCSLDDAQGKPDERLAEVDLFEMARLMICHDDDDLPWQVAGPEIMRLGASYQAFRLGDAYAVLLDTQQGVVALRSVFVPTEARGQGQATRLMQALFYKCAGSRFYFPAICPEAVSEGFFEKLGFIRDTKISQFQMRLKL
jgi:GNAT superfamily N-acetyltransferase